MEAEPTFVEPKTEEISIKGKLVGTFEDIAKRLSNIPWSIENTGSQLNLVMVESRDIQKRPFLFVLVELGKERANISYTIANTGPNLRRLVVLKSTMGIMSLITDLYELDSTELYQYIDSAIDQVVGGLSQSYSSLFNSYDSIFNEYKDLKRMNVELSSSTKTLSVQAAQLQEENKKLIKRVSELEVYADDPLMVMVQDWLDSHGAEIDVNEFGKTYKLSPTRVEEILNKMVSLGYIEVKG